VGYQLSSGYAVPNSFHSKNSAQKTLHDLLDHDYRGWRPKDPAEANERLDGLSINASVKSRDSHPSADNTLVEERQSKSLEQGGTATIDWQELGLPPTHPAPQPSLNNNLTWGLPPEAGPARNQSGSNRHSFTPHPPTRRSTILSAATEASTASLQELRKAASNLSNRALRKVHRVLKHYTISSESEITGGSPLRLTTANLLRGELRTHPGFAVAGDLINPASFKILCNQDRLHHARLCWCSIAACVAAEPDSKYTLDGDLSEAGQTALSPPPRVIDQFGNTSLHFAACSGPDRLDELRLMLQKSDASTICATNRAGQTFLHVLHSDWFDAETLDEVDAPLKQLLQSLRVLASKEPALGPAFYFARDCYGRTFFHRLHALVPSRARNDRLVSQFFDPAFVAANLERDAFGDSPVNRTSSPPAYAFSNLSVVALSPLIESSPVSPNPQQGWDQQLADHHSRLIKTVLAAQEDPMVEDEQGRNGLHCVAEALLNNAAMVEALGQQETGKSRKRKYHKKDEPEGSAASQQKTRLDTVHVLLNTNGQSAKGPVNINHYDLNGNTPLMTFIEHVSDGDDDKFHSLPALLNLLIDRGANIEARNRRAETPLLVAARKGRKCALTILLDRSANVHARDVDGRSALAILDDLIHSPEARKETKSYAQWEACRATLLSYKSRPSGAVLQPTVVQEWSAR
jgi:hypothetical protein